MTRTTTTAIPTVIMTPNTINYVCILSIQTFFKLKISVNRFYIIGMFEVLLTPNFFFKSPFFI
ncbi:Hypothetical protein Nlim_0572 [Candidatus Nitrosarchaeum limnium SFB1]|uniref:Uncharacterized protein n=1 Tax=Candidatus Nitrosarchaeum limnium SFB1 TaxID=886738 RepID=F3KJB3_9ARCH|nr:Hypothetical protein Nlim_0572 [Candidatus Nitrosarchaeum limnium SFB1]